MLVIGEVSALLISSDAKALEWHSIVQLADDPVALAELHNGVDIHTTNQKAFDLPDRLTAKKYLFRSIFNEGKGYAFSVDPDFMHVSSSKEYWNEVGEKFYSKYKALRKTHTEWKRFAATGKQIPLPSGRQFSFTQKANFRGEMEWDVNKIINYPVQSTGADIMMLARISFASRLKKMNLPKVLLLSTVHDSIVIDTPKEHVQDLVNLFHQVFDDLPKNVKKCWDYEWKTPLACECSVGYNMADMDEVKRDDK
jgi:DNA polymerase I-like protein with 3'-5' exonuclease and polymerase domains